MPHDASRLAYLFAVALLGCDLGAGAAVAQPQRVETSSGWQYQIAPYFWAASLKGDAATFPGLPTVPIDESFGDILEDLEFAAMVLAEARRGDWGLSLNIAYTSVSSDTALPGPNFSSASLDSTTFFATPAVSYRAYKDERVFLDVGAGGRIWYVKNEIRFNAGTSPTVSTDESKSWVDPIVLARANVALGGGFSVVGYGDIGGFGIASDLTWQLIGLAGYQFNDWIDGAIGYRHLSVDYENDGFVWDVRMSGPILGVSFRF